MKGSMASRGVLAPLLLVVAAAVPVVFSCGGETPPPEAPPPAPPTAPAPPETAPPVASASVAPEADAAAPAVSASAAPVASAPSGPNPPWDAMTKEQKTDYMKTAVMPKMKAEFQAFDGTKYASFGCRTCHGKGAKAGTFKMPNPDLPKLSPADNFKKHMDAKPDLTKFMMQKVVPDMAAVLGEHPYDPATQQGFGCFDCHTMAK